MIRRAVLGIAVIWVLGAPALSWAQAAPAPAPAAGTTTATTATTTVPSTTVGTPTIPNPSLQFLTAPVNGQANTSSKYRPTTANPNALTPSCAFEDALNECAVQW